MRNLTKASREASRAVQFESLLNSGYSQETYKGLEIFKHSIDLLLKVFIGTAANHSIFYRYRSIEQLEAKIQAVKKSCDLREQYKAERIEKNKGAKRLTLATLKAFLNKNEANIFVRVLSSFDGMQDMVDTVKDEFKNVPKSETPKDYNLGFSGLYLVGGSRDSIEIYEDGIYTGFKIYNSCGSCLVATPKKIEQAKAAQTPASGKIQIVDYSEKAIAVIGEISEHYDNLINLGGKYNSRLSCGKGIIFSKKRFEDVKAYFLAQSEASAQQEEEETPENEHVMLLHPELEPAHPLNICDPQSGQYKEALKEHQEAQILPSQINNTLQLDSFKILWHEGYQSPSYEGAIFTNWADVQRAFYTLWERNEKGQGGGYTKVKCEIKLQGKPAEVCRVDITDRPESGDFCPSVQHIADYLTPLIEEEETTQITKLISLFPITANC